MTQELTPYRTEFSKIENGKGYWDYTNVKIFKDNIEIFTFVRNYPSHAKETIEFFIQDNKEYMLFSERYVDISILDLQTMEPKQLHLYEKDGKEAGFGFCPIHIYVPKFTDECVQAWSYIKDEDTTESHLPIAFVQGCQWGADWGNYDLRVLDLRDLNDIRYFPDVWEHLSHSYRLDISEDIAVIAEFEDGKLIVDCDIPVHKYKHLIL